MISESVRPLYWTILKVLVICETLYLCYRSKNPSTYLDNLNRDNIQILLNRIWDVSDVSLYTVMHVVSITVSWLQRAARCLLRQ